MKNMPHDFLTKHDTSGHSDALESSRHLLCGATERAKKHSQAV